MQNMTSGNPTLLLIKFSIPMLVGNIFQQIYMIVDSIIIGRYLGSEALACMGNTGDVVYFLTALTIGLCTGAAIIVAQCFGAQNYKRLGNAVTSMIWLVGIFTVVIAVIGLACSHGILKMMQMPESVLVHAEAYLRIIFIFSLGTIAYNGAGAILQSLGDSKTPLYALVIGALLNIGLDLLFILQFNMGVAGAALATVLAQHVSAVVCIGQLVRKKEAYGLTGLPVKPDKEMMVLIFKTGVPTALQNSLIACGNMSVLRLINSFGASVMAGYTAASYIANSATMLSVSVGAAVSVFAGQNMGQKLYDRIGKGLRSAVALLVAAGCIMAVCFNAWSEELIQIFVKDGAVAEVVATGAEYLSIMGIAYVIAGIMQSYLGVLRGVGDVGICLTAGMAELAGRVAFSYLLVNFMGIRGVWVAIPLGWGCACIVPVIRYYSGRWKNKYLA